jgi:hypothetical protein
VKVVRTSDRVVLHFPAEEFRVFREILKLHAQMPPLKQRLSKSGGLPDREASQRLLDDALAEHRAANQKRLGEWLADPARLEQTETAVRLALSAGETEWLLQILNELRIGCWLLLGSPEELGPPSDEAKAPHFLLMMLCEAFQAQLLEVPDREDPPRSSHEI